MKEKQKYKIGQQAVYIKIEISDLFQGVEIRKVFEVKPYFYTLSLSQNEYFQALRLLEEIMNKKVYTGL